MNHYLPSPRARLAAGALFLIIACGPLGRVHAQFGTAADGVFLGGKTDPGIQFRPLVEMIVTTIEPESWADVGGPGQITAVDDWGVITISQTAPVHEKIETLIHVLREAKSEKEAGSGMTPHPPAEDAARSASVAIESPEESAARKRLEAALASPVSLDFRQRPLKEVVDELAVRHEIPITVDVRGLEDQGYPTDVPISAKIGGISLRSALHLLLRELELTFVLRDETVQITSQEVADELIVTRVYKVQDLAVSPESE